MKFINSSLWFGRFFAIVFVLMASTIAWPTEVVSNYDGVRCLTLRDAVDIALASNRNLIAVSNLFQNSDLSLQAARSAYDLTIYPSANLGASDGNENVGAGILLDKKFYSGVDMTIFPSITRSNDMHSGAIGFALGVPLLRGRGEVVNLDAIKSSAFSLKSAEHSLYQARISTVIATISAIYNIIEQKEIAHLLENQVAAMKGHAEAANLKKDVGLATAMDVYRAMIRLKDVQDQLSTTLNDLASDRDTLKGILALPLSERIEVIAPLEWNDISMPLDEAVQTALENRIEIVHARDALEETERKALVAKHNLLPQLDFVLDYERYSKNDHLSQAANLTQDRWSINLVSTTDWARTREKTTYQQSLLNVRNAKLAVESKKDEVITEVRHQIEILKKWKERIEIKNDQIRQAVGKQKLSRIKFDHGMADNFDLIEAESELFQARANLISVKTELIVNQYKLRSVLGILFDRKGKLNLG